MKSEAPDAFTPKCPFVPKVVFFDGMPNLQVAGAVTRWDDFVRFNFANRVQKFMSMGTGVCVLAFDDYAHVPMAKSITQANRCKNKTFHDVDERHTLSAHIPGDYKNLIANRVFKRKVIEMVICEITSHLRPVSPDQKFIVDYTRAPLLYKYDAGTRKWVFEEMPGIPPNGECDIKWTRWCRMYGDCVAVSVDGDFLPIALLEHQRQVAELGPNADPIRMAVYRMEYNMKDGDGANGKKKKGAVAGVKRDAQGRAVATAATTAAQQQAGQAPPVKRRTFEYVDITLLYHVLVGAMAQCAPSGVGNRQCELRYMSVLAFLIGISGTDFSRKVPHLGPKKIWDSLPMKNIWPALMRVYDPVTDQVNVSEACDLFIARLYLDKFRKHARGEDLDSVMASLMNSKLSDKTKGELASVFAIDVTIRNTNFILHYWRCRQPKAADDGGWDYSEMYPDPIQDEFGFRYVEKASGKRAVQWLDA